MLNGTSTHRQPSSHPATAAPREEPPLPALHPFICVSASLRHLLLQAEITAPRLHLATLEGEPGTGKHLFAQTIHRQTAFAALPFLRRDAREWLANETEISLTGTLYLDRVDLLAPVGQGLLLSFVKAVQTDVASTQRFLLLVSSHTSLRHLASQGQFLPDLAFRLTAVRFLISPLREHREDIAPITQALIERICRRYQQPTAVLAPGTLPHLLQHSWPGNVRELASVLESAILDSTTGILQASDLHLQKLREPSPLPAIAAPAAPVPEPTEPLTLDAAIQRHIQMVLGLNRGNKLRAARQLGISRSTLYRLLSGDTLSKQAAILP